MLATGMKCIKYLLFIFNLIFILCGVGLMAVGAYVWVAVSKVTMLSLSALNGPAIVIIIIGVVVFIVSFFGCCGAIKENYCMTMTFSVLLCIILICEISAAIAAYVLWGRVTNAIEESDQFDENKCCDVMNNLDSPCEKDPQGNVKPHSCQAAFVNYIKRYIFIVGGVGVSFAVIEIAGIIFACCLGKAIRKGYEVA